MGIAGGALDGTFRCGGGGGVWLGGGGVWLGGGGGAWFGGLTKLILLMAWGGGGGGCCVGIDGGGAFGRPLSIGLFRGLKFPVEFANDWFITDDRLRTVPNLSCVLLASGLCGDGERGVLMLWARLIGFPFKVSFLGGVWGLAKKIHY